MCHFIKLLQKKKKFTLTFFRHLVIKDFFALFAVFSVIMSKKGMKTRHGPG